MKLERILSETNFPDSSNSSLEQPVLVHCLLCLSFQSQSTQYSSVDWPILTPLDLPPPSPPCRGASRRFQAKVPRHVQPVGRSGRRGQQSVSEPASLCPSVSSPPPVLLNFRQFCMQSGFAAGQRSLLRPSQSRKAPSPAQIRNPTEFNDLGLDAGPKIRDVQAIQQKLLREESRRELYYTTILDSQKPPFGFKLLPLLVLYVVRLSAHRLHL